MSATLHAVPYDRLGQPQPRARLAVFYGRLPPGLLLVGSIIAIQLGTALAGTLAADVGSCGITFLSLAAAACLSTIMTPPRLRVVTPRGAAVVVALGLAILGMTLPLFMALRALPLGIVATISFLGPLTAALVMTRRWLDLFPIGLTLVGIGLLTPLSGARLDLGGVILASIGAVCWALFIPLSKRAGQYVRGNDGLTLATWVAAIGVLPFALAEGTVFHLSLLAVAGGIAVAVLTTVVPLRLEYDALRRMSARTYGILVSLEPAIGAVVGAACLGQGISPRSMAAIACISLASIVVTILDRSSDDPVG